MRKNLRITVDGRTYDVVVEEIDQASSPPEPAPRVVAPVTVASPAPAPAPPPAPAAPPAAGENAIAAPIGGVVRSIDVEVGGVVAVGDKVATIEVMKMKTQVISKLAGKVLSIVAHVNEPVETGQVMVTLG